MGIELSRTGGGIGTRGPGETKLESDRRHIRTRIAALEEELREIKKHRQLLRSRREKDGVITAAIVGYTNAGKSTLLNALTGAGVLSEDKLFATLDPTTRKLELPCGETILLTDTVGFIRKLPHHLVKAFKSTLDEVVYADILLIVSDVNDPEVAEHIEVTKEVIEDLSSSDKPIIYVYNKCDLLSREVPSTDNDDTVFVSGVTGKGIDNLLSAIERTVQRFKKKYTLLIPYTSQALVSALYNNYTVLSTEYLDEGISVEVILDEKGRGMYGKYVVEG
jgi:GTP-binding protein HflX